MEVVCCVYAQLEFPGSNVFEQLQDALLGLVVVIGAANVVEHILPEFFDSLFWVTVGREEQRRVVAKKDTVDVDADEDADFADILQLFAQLEVAAGTKIANHGMEDVEVGHCGGDAVELVHQPRLDIVEKLGAHRLGVLCASPFEVPQKRIRETFCLYLRFAKTLNANEKAHGYTVSISAFSCIKY